MLFNSENNPQSYICSMLLLERLISQKGLCALGGEGGLGLAGWARTSI